MNGYEIEIGKSQDFVCWAIDVFIGNAHISFEGKFSLKEFLNIEGYSLHSNEILKKNTLSPETDFIIFPLENETKELIIKSVIPRIGLRKNVYHIQIEKEGKIIIGIYDNLRHCWMSENVHPNRLVELEKSEVIKSFRRHQNAT